MALRAVDDHPKLARLKMLLKCGRGVAMGMLEASWHFAGRYTPQGNIGKYSNEEIEAWIEWDGEPGKLIQALLTAGWLENSSEHRLIVHDWHDHADDATRLALKRKSLPFLTMRPDGVPTLSGSSGDVVAEMKTESGLPVPVPEPESEPVKVSDAKASSPRLVDGARAHIEAIYALYPRKEGKGAAIKAIAKSLSRLRKGESPLQPMSPMEAKDHLAKRCKLYASSPIVISLDRDKIPHPATWFNQSRYLDDEFEWGFNGKLNRQQQQGLDDFRARMKSRSTPKQVGYVEPSEADRIARHINATYGNSRSTSVDEMVKSAVADGLFSDSNVSPDLVIDIISEWREIEVMAGRAPAIMPKAVNG